MEVAVGAPAPRRSRIVVRILWSAGVTYKFQTPVVSLMFALLRNYALMGDKRTSHIGDAMPLELLMSTATYRHHMAAYKRHRHSEKLPPWVFNVSRMVKLAVTGMAEMHRRPLVDYDEALRADTWVHDPEMFIPGIFEILTFDDMGLFVEVEEADGRHVDYTLHELLAGHADLMSVVCALTRVVFRIAETLRGSVQEGRPSSNMVLDAVKEALACTTRPEDMIQDRVMFVIEQPVGVDPGPTSESNPCVIFNPTFRVPTLEELADDAAQDDPIAPGLVEAFRRGEISNPFVDVDTVRVRLGGTARPEKVTNHILIKQKSSSKHGGGGGSSSGGQFREGDNSAGVVANHHYHHNGGASTSKLLSLPEAASTAAPLAIAAAAAASANQRTTALAYASNKLGVASDLLKRTSSSPSATTTTTAPSTVSLLTAALAAKRRRTEGSGGGGGNDFEGPTGARILEVLEGIAASQQELVRSQQELTQTVAQAVQRLTDISDHQILTQAVKMLENHGLKIGGGGEEMSEINGANAVRMDIDSQPRHSSQQHHQDGAAVTGNAGL